MLNTSLLFLHNRKLLRKIMKNFYAYIVLAMLIITSSCQKDENTSIENTNIPLLKIAESFALGAATKVELWSDAELSTGRQNLFLALYDSTSKNIINKATVEIMPMMYMDMNGSKMNHSAPFESPSLSTAENSKFPCSATFTMPSTGTSGVWKLNVKVKKEGDSKFGMAEIPITVKASSPERVKVITAADGSKLVISYISPTKPKVGINDFEIKIHKRKDMMNFPADDSYSIVMTPEMPSMGHGSPNNINPVHIKNGLYKGKVNFTMTGDWRINLELNKDGKTSTTFFDLLF